MYKEKELRALIALFFIVLVVSLFSCGYQESDGISNSNKVASLDSDMGNKFSDMLSLNVKKNMHPKLESILNDLHEEFQTKGMFAAQEFVRKKSISLKDGEEKVTVFLYAEVGKTTKDIDKTALSEHGAEVIKSTEKIMKVSVPVEKLKEIANNVSGISFIKLPDKPIPQTVSEGVSVSGADMYHAAGFTGSGVKVAVIDLEFKYTSSVISNGELPDDTVLVDCTGSSCVSTTFSSETGEHGTAVAEIVHDMAPDAKLYLIKVGDQLDLKDAKDYCVSNNIKIVNHSAGWFNQNFYDGECYNDNPDCTVDDAYTNGILWVNSAGNSAQKHYSATFTDANSNGWHDTLITFTAYAGDTISIWATWNDWPTSSNDYDIHLFNPAVSIVDSSINSQTGTQPPIENISYTPLVSGTYTIIIDNYLASGNHKFEIFSSNHSLDQAVASGSIISPAESSHAFAVGAIDYNNYTTGPQESYSSQGPTNDGRTKPEIAGPYKTTSYTYSLSGYSSFPGTSASSPHVAGAAALILSQNPTYTVTQLWNALTGMAIDMGDTGQDNIYGYGRLNLPVPDTTAPDTTITSQPTNPSNSTSASFSFTSTETGSTFLCQMDSGGYSACTSPKSYTGLTAGSHTFYVKATDSAGNIDSTPASYTWTIDTTAPDTTISINSGAASTNSTTATLTLSCTDTNGCSQMQFSNDNSTWSTAETYTTSKTWTLSSGDGTKTVYAKFKDRAGNWSSAYSDTIDLPTSYTSSPPCP